MTTAAMVQLSFEGLDVVGQRASLNAVHVIPPRHLKLGERVRVTIEASVVGVYHEYEKDDDGNEVLVRNHKLKALDAEFDA